MVGLRRKKNPVSTIQKGIFEAKLWSFFPWVANMAGTYFLISPCLPINVLATEEWIPFALCFWLCFPNKKRNLPKYAYTCNSLVQKYLWDKNVFGLAKIFFSDVPTKLVFGVSKFYKVLKLVFFFSNFRTGSSLGAFQGPGETFENVGA